MHPSWQHLAAPLRPLAAVAAITFIYAAPVAAVGIQPETSIVLVREADGEGTMTVRNVSDTPVLLLSTLEHIPEDTEEWVMVTPPAAVVEPGQTQMVRFVLSSGTPLAHQRLKRAIFEGIPQTAEQQNAVRFTVRQNLPLIAIPKGKKAEREPWKSLQWQVRDEVLSVTNPSPYVVRLDQHVRLLPSDTASTLPKPYILPGETLAVEREGGIPGTTEQVRVFPATIYGYQVPHFDATIQK